MKFPRDKKFDSSFSNIKNIRFYPYVGKEFDNQEKRIMVFAHNIPVPTYKYNSEQKRTQSPTHFADAMEEFTYEKGWWTKTWQNFIKASTGLKTNYSVNSDTQTIKKIDNFVNRISYTNFINDLVESDNSTNVKIPHELIEKSKRINASILAILGITHCVCWGKEVFNYMKDNKTFEVIEQSDYSKKGFGYMKVKNLNGGQKMHVLKVFHPSMPGFGQFKNDTQEILQTFYSLE